MLNAKLAVMNRTLCGLLLMCFALAYYAGTAIAGTAILTWDAPTAYTDGSPITDLAGYKIYYGTAPGSYSASMDVGLVTTYTVNNLADGSTYYFSVTAYNTARIEGGFSNEVSKVVLSSALQALSTTRIGTGAGSITSSPSGILCGSTCSATFNAGTIVTLSAVPDPNSLFTGWSGACTGSGTCVVTMNAAKTVTASFTLRTYTLSATAGTNGSISPSGASAVPYGASQTFTIKPNTGYYIYDVAVDGVSVGAVSTYTFTNVTANHTIAATIKIKSYSITPTAGDGGTISPATRVWVVFGGTKTFTITPNAGYRISGVVVDGKAVGAVSTYAFTNLTAIQHTISATFEAITYTLTAGVSGSGGSIVPANVLTVLSGGNGAFTITPDAGHHVSDVIVDGKSVGPVSSYTFSNISANHSIVASFAINTYTIIATVTGGGAISPSGPVSALQGGNAVFSIGADAGHVITDVRVDGVSIGRVTSHTFTNIAANHTIEAVISANLSCPDPGIPCIERVDGQPDGNNLVNGSPNVGVEFEFRAVVADDGGSPQYVRLAMAQKSDPVAADYHLYEMNCSGDFSTGSLCTYRTELPPAAQYAFFIEALLSDGSLVRFSREGSINGPQIELLTAATFTIALQPGWNNITNPYRENIALSNILIQKGVATPVPWLTAAANGWLNNALYDFSGSDGVKIRLFEQAGIIPDALLVPWRTYWVYLKNDDAAYTLLVTKPLPKETIQ